jgi:transcriptional antiterminator Rof (Rho-off)
VQRHDALELVCEVRAPLRLTLAEGLVLAVVGRWQMIDTGEQRAEELAVVDDAADRDAAEADAMIAALASDQAGAGGGAPPRVLWGRAF